MAAVHSFDHRMVADARRLAPPLARGVLETSYHVDPSASLRAVAARDLWQHEALIDAHHGLSDEQSEALNARLILLLANHIGDLRVLRSYERERKAALLPMGMAMDGLQQLFTRREGALAALRKPATAGA